MTTVGVGVAVYNGAATVAQALASIASQTRLPDRVVVVDDGSSDGTLAAVEPWRQLLPMEIVRHEINQGVSSARTTAVSHLDTDVVVALDADDFWLPYHLGRLLAAYEEHPGIVSPMAVAWKPKSAVPVDWRRRLQPKPPAPDLCHLLIMNWIFAGSMFGRAAFRAAGGCYRFDGTEDWDLWLRLLKDDIPVTLLDEPTVLYRVHSGSISADDRLLPTEVQVLEAFLEETSDPQLRTAARRSLRHRHARLALRTAYDHARRGRSPAARLAAVKALSGPAPVGVRGAAMIVAPRFTLRRRDKSREVAAQ